MHYALISLFFVSFRLDIILKVQLSTVNTMSHNVHSSFLRSFTADVKMISSFGFVNTISFGNDEIQPDRIPTLYPGSSFGAPPPETLGTSLIELVFDQCKACVT